MTTLSITPSLEDYLETIFIIKQKKGIVRVKDLTQYLQIKGSSVVESLKKLKKKNLITQEYYGYIELTQEGINLAKKLRERHIMLKKFLHNILGVKEKIAEKDACKIEHYLSEETLKKILKFILFIENYPKKPSWLQRYHTSLKDESEEEKTNKVVSLSELKPGERGKILKIVEIGPLKRKLLDMGFVREEIVEVKKIAPLGSPIDIKIKNTHISLRKEEAEKIIVKKED